MTDYTFKKIKLLRQKRNKLEEKMTILEKQYHIINTKIFKLTVKK